MLGAAAGILVGFGIIWFVQVLPIIAISIGAAVLLLTGALYVYGGCKRCKKTTFVLCRDGKFLSVAIVGTLITSLFAVACATAVGVAAAVLAALVMFFFVMLVFAVLIAANGFIAGECGYRPCRYDAGESCPLDR